MKNRLITVVFFGLLLSGFAGVSEAQEEDGPFAFSASVDLVSDYVWRGVSQSDEDLAIQGGFEVGLGGFYLATWGSNVDFNETGVDGADLELDGLIGFRHDLGENAGFDLGLCNYFYPGSEAELDWLEAYATVSWRWFGFGVYYSNEVFGTEHSGLYLDASVSFDLPAGFGVAVGVGQYSFDQEVVGVGAPDSYLYWSAGISWSKGPASIGLTYYGTDNDGEILFGDWAGDRIVLGLSASL